MAKRELINNDLATVRVNENVTDAIDKTVDFVEDAVEATVHTVEKVVTVTKSNPFLLAGALLLGAGIGGAIAYKITVSKITAKYEARIETEIAKSREFYQRASKEGVFETPESAVEALVPEDVVHAVTTYKGRGGDPRTPYNRPEEARVDIQTKTVKVTIADKLDEPRGWDYDSELAKRAERPNDPYVISMDEFNEGEETFDKSSLTYYEADDTLVDERDTPIDTVEYTVGEDNLTNFGHGSGDHNVVYIRNEKIGSDFEIVRSKGSYSHDVLGMEPEPPRKNLRHSNTRRGGRRFEED